MKTAQNKIAMKAILIIVAAFGIQISTLVASNIGDKVIPTEPNNNFCPECPILSPKVPLEAPFVEMTEFDFTLDLSPVVPMEATFDNDIEVELTANSLAPVFPSQADFDDDVVFPINQDSNFAPVVPSAANFTDKL